MEETVPTNICRACLTEEGEFQSVFVSDENSGLTIHLAEMIMANASVQITLGDGLPEQICIPCAKKAVLTYLFKQRCEESDATLRDRLGKSPINRVYSIREEQQLATTALEIDPDAIDIIIKPEINLENEESQTSQIQITEVSTEMSEHIDYSSMYSKSDRGSDSEPDIKIGLKYECDICLKTFNRPSHLNRHKKNHVLPKQFICTTCGKGFSRNDLLMRHQLIHTIKAEQPAMIFDAVFDQEIMTDATIEVKTEEIDEDVKCIDCNIDFSKKDEYGPHIPAHMGKESNLKCSICHKKFTKASHVTRHLKIHSAIKPHVCRMCNKGFARSEQLINHMNVHSGVKPHVCNICTKGFNQVSNLKDHMRTHNGEKPFLCSICGKGFNQLGNLRQHTIRHSGIKAHLCSVCGNGFASKGELGAHLRKHTGARPFVCAVCNHGFTTSSSLTKHKRIHSGEKPYECEVCKMKFSRSGILARHKRTHTGEKPYVCKYCSKAFSQSNDLSSHLRIHTGEKPFICDCCGQAFRQSSALKTHKKTHMDRSSLLELERTRALVPMVHSTFLNALQ